MGLLEELLGGGLYGGLGVAEQQQRAFGGLGATQQAINPFEAFARRTAPFVQIPLIQRQGVPDVRPRKKVESRTLSPNEVAKVQINDAVNSVKEAQKLLGD